MNTTYIRRGIHTQSSLFCRVFGSLRAASLSAVAKVWSITYRRYCTFYRYSFVSSEEECFSKLSNIMAYFLVGLIGVQYLTTSLFGFLKQILETVKSRCDKAKKDAKK